METWDAITRLAEWAEPLQNQPVPPFRWVGYNGDAGHGCGNHLHLSWQHAPAPMFQLAEWVEVFPTAPAGGSKPRTPRPSSPPQKLPTGPPGGVGELRDGRLERGQVRVRPVELLGHPELSYHRPALGYFFR